MPGLGAQSRPDTQGNPALVLLYDNAAKTQAGATAVANSQQPTGDLVPARALDDALDIGARSGSIVSLPGGVYEFDVTLGRPTSIDTILVHGHDIRSPIRAQFYRNPPAEGGEIWDSGPIAPIVRADLESFTFQEWDFSGGPSERDLQGQADRQGLSSVIYAPEVFSGVTHFRFSIDGTAGANLAMPWGPPTASSDFYTFSYIMATKRFRPRVNMVNGWASGWESRTITQRLEGGGLHGRKRQGLMKIPLDMNFLTPEEGIHHLYTRLIRDEDLLGRIFVVPVPHTPEFFHETSFMATITSQGGAAMRAFRIMQTTLELTETK